MFYGLPEQPTLLAYTGKLEVPPMTVVETPFFLRKAAGLIADEERERLIVFIAANPEAGDVIPESGGVRKLRWAARGQGKERGRAGDLLFWRRSDSGVLVDHLREESKSEPFEGGAE